ncbi:MAG: hypothetical protein ACR2HN_00515 [Tepidiformaceae bacterium]
MRLLRLTNSSDILEEVPEEQRSWRVAERIVTELTGGDEPALRFALVVLPVDTTFRGLPHRRRPHHRRRRRGGPHTTPSIGRAP